VDPVLMWHIKGRGIVQDFEILRVFLERYFGTIIFCQMSQDVGKLRCLIAEVPLYLEIEKIKNNATFFEIQF
jgi:hypothetical protein